MFQNELINFFRNIDQMAYTETVKYKLLMQSDTIRRLETMVKTMKKSPRTHENCKYSLRKPENKMESPRTHKNNNRLFVSNTIANNDILIPIVQCSRFMRFIHVR